MKKIIVTVEHELTPMHQEIMETALVATLKGLLAFWKEKSVKHFDVNVEYIDETK